MQFGIALATDAESWKVVARAEALGFSHAWFYDTQMLSADCFVAMGAAAVKTSRIRLGTGVLIPSNRIAAVTANAFASLNKLAPGRIDFGVGTGFTGRRAMGLGAIKLAEMEDYVRVVLALLRGETVETDIEGSRRKIRFLNPGLGLINTHDPIGLHVSAYGPRAMALTAKLGAGWLNFVGDEAGGAKAINGMRAAWAKSGRAQDGLGAVAFALGCVLQNGEAADSPRHGPGRAARRGAAAPRRRRGALRPAQHVGRAPRSGRRDCRLRRPRPRLPAGGCAVAREPPRAPDVRQG
jgi:5,10-methylenetetrahydromethanopterin reductase